jgi:hypothetical protein
LKRKPLYVGPFLCRAIRLRPCSQWWKILAFSENVQAELMRLVDGDSISVQGTFKAELYDAKQCNKDGERPLSLSIIADSVLALRQPSKTRKLGKKPQPYPWPMTKGPE